MALSALAKKINRFHKLHSQAKELTKELELLKASFREESGGTDMVFTHKDIDVIVTNKSSTRWDYQRLYQHLGDLAKDFKSCITFQEVSCRKTAARKAG